MTICVAAICGNGTAVVVATDRMITASYPPVEFEHDVPKLEKLGASCVALTAGDALAHIDLFRAAKGTLAGLSDPSTQLISEQVRLSYSVERLKTAEHRFLGARGWTLQQFYNELPGKVPPDVFLAVDHQVSTYDYGLDILVAGVDSEAHIYSVRNPGQIDCFDSLGYNAIGSGELHAMSRFISNGCSASMSVNEATYLAFEAKRTAEIAPGVGTQLDMANVRHGKIHTLTDEEIGKLDEIHKERMKPQATEATDQGIRDLPFDK